MVRWRRRILLRGILWLLLFGMLNFIQSDAQTKQTRGYVAGAFIVPDLWNGLTYEQAQEVVKKAGEIGISNLILQYSAQKWPNGTITTFYAGPDNFIDLLFGAAESYNQTADNKVMITIGLQIAEENWFQDKLYQDSEQLRSEAEFSLKLAEKLSMKYLESEAFLGWYLPFEIDNYSHCYLPDGQSPQDGDTKGWGAQMIEHYFKPVSEGLYLKDSEKIIMISPLIYSRQENQQDIQNWNRMVKAIAEETKINILAPQDGLGWGNSTLESLQSWYQGMQETLEGTKVHFYNNAENYTLEGDGYMDLQKWLHHIDGLSNYVEETITFSLHRLIPRDQSDRICEKFYQAYKDYVIEQSTIKSEDLAEQITAAVTGNDYSKREIKIIRIQEDLNTAKFAVFKKKPDGAVIKVTELSAIGKELYCIDNTNMEPGDIYIITAKSAYGELDSASYPSGKIVGQASLETTQMLRLLSQDKINKDKMEINRDYVHYSPLTLSALLFNGDINPYTGEEIRLDGSQWYDTAVGFFGKQNIEIEIPFYGEEMIKQIAVQIPADQASAVYLPSQIKVFYSSDQIQYEQLGVPVLLNPSGKPQEHYTASIGDLHNEIKASSIKIVIEPSSENGWTFIDEISIYTVESLSRLNQKLIKTDEIIWENQYVCHSPFPAEDLLFDGNIDPDTGKPIRLDGSQWYRTAVGFQTRGETIRFVVPFSEEVFVSYVEVQASQDKEASIYLPYRVKILYSTDGIHYQQHGEDTILHQLPQNKAHRIIAAGNALRSVKATSIKIEIVPFYNNSWIFIDELMIYGID